MIDSQLESINGKQALVSQLDGVPMDTMREMTEEKLIVLKSDSL